MNRVFKFRVWDTRLKRYIDFGCFHGQLNYDDFLLTTTGELFAVAPYEKEDFVIQQFTGFKDKKGREIYEGDVLRSHSKFLVGFGQYKDAEHEGHTGFWLKSEKFNSEPFGFGEWYDEKISEKYEVVGNIFENPELTKLFGEI